MAYDHPRLVALYDEDNPDGPDHDWFRALADEKVARTILDLGCGTGLLTVTLAGSGRTVLGIDPSAAMLEVARSRPGGEQVQWIHGTSGDIPRGVTADLAVMSANVVQHLLGEDLGRTLSHLASPLSPGAVLAFESRNPVARAWEDWAHEGETERDTAQGRLRESAEVGPPDGNGVVRCVFTNRFEDGEVVTEELILAFRTREQIEDALRTAGFDRIQVWRDWQRTPFTGDGPLMVFEARRA
ncbi:MAG: class I SAM-dependent methyltransferase [Brachybacterium sp.]|nr:class I SAM-dependent methyltransferase [Brachybacterium sp.]